MWSRVIGIAALTFFVSSTVHAQRERAAGSARGRVVEPEITEDGSFYVVVEGDTLSEIAVRLEVSTEDLLRWNEGLEADRISVGRRLRIETGLRRVEHVVQRGEALSRIAAHYEVSVREILRWNRRLRADMVRSGRTLVVFTAVPESRSRSIGHPHSGHLADAAQMPRRHPLLQVRTASRAWGTDETVRWTVEAYDALRAHDSSSPRVEVHDLSRRRGGTLMGHVSHRSGRDADLAYFQRRCDGVCGFRRIGPDSLDVERQWRIFHHWLSRDQVEAIFVDHALQRALYREARRQGVSRRDLSRWFQYPRAASNRHGVIRHHPRHADHFHVRFVCHDTDEECR